MRDLFVLRVENQLAEANINRMYRLRPWLNQNEFRFIIRFDQICKRFLHFQTFSNSLTESSNGWKASFFISTPFLRIGHTKLIINISNHVRDEHVWKPIFYYISYKLYVDVYMMHENGVEKKRKTFVRIQWCKWQNNHSKHLQLYSIENY